ncbi:MAG: BatA domain-containing protein [Desulfobacterales bacterium]|nr:MAG: BatA domain-containing protein [Desulfobacterales bacterium]
MSFLSPWFLLGLLGVGIPLAVHLSRREKAEKIVFSTIRFLKRAPQKMILFQRIQQWLLLVTRAALIALLAVAFARPFITGSLSETAGWSPRSVVILLDTSMSMAYGDTFDRAKKAVLEILQALHSGDEAALVTFSDGPGGVAELTTDLARVAAFVRHLEAPGFRATAYLPALRLADRMLKSARHRDHTVYLVSDYQRRAVDNLDSRWQLSSGVAFKGIKIGDEKTTNLAVTEVKSPARLIRDQEEHIVLGRVRNLGARSPSEARTSLIIDGKTVETQNVDLTDRSEAVVKFRTTFRKRGVYRGAVTVEDDSFAPDNTFYFTVDVSRPLAVVSVIDDASAIAHADEAYWLESALGKPPGSPFRLDVIRPVEITKDVVARYDVVALPDVGDLTPAQVTALKSYVESGGSLLIAPANRVEAETFNRLFRGLAPAALDEKHTGASADFLRIAEINRRHSLIKSMGLGESGDFGVARFHGHWFTTPAEGSDVIMRFDNGAAALLEGRIGRGRVLLFTSSLDTEWNNLPRQGLYVPFIHEMLRYLVHREEKKQSYTVGEPVRLIMPPDSAVRVIGPHGSEKILTSIADDDVFYRETLRPGFYEIRGPGIHDFLAVNVSPLESDLSFADPPEIGDHRIDRNTRMPSPEESGTLALEAAAEKSQRFWWWMLLCVLFLGLGETLLANRTYR